jgi:RHS repeat-associated protein
MDGYIDPKKNVNNEQVTARYSYDAANRLKQVKDALGQITTYEYDENGQITNVRLQTNESAAPQTIHTKTYNEAGAIMFRMDSTGNATAYQYNELGLVSQITDRNQNVTAMQYDEQNNLIQTNVTNASGAFENLQINIGSNGILFSTATRGASDAATVTQSTGMDHLLRITSQQTQSVNYFSVLGLQYDVNNRMTRITSSGLISGSFTVNYKYAQERLDKVQTDGQSQVTDADNANVQYMYEPNGRIRSIVYPKLTDGSSLKTEYTYTSFNQIKTVTNTKGSTVLSMFSYTYDDNGNIDSKTESGVEHAAQTSYYAYDKLNRLQSITGWDDRVITYSYDVKGNRTVRSDTGEDEDRDAQATKKYTYDLMNRLRSVTVGTSTTTFDYSTDGLRYKKSSGSYVTQYRYNRNGEVIAEVDERDQTRANYVRGDRVLAKNDSDDGRSYYYLYNGHGDVVQIIDTDGNIVNSYAYDEWGNITDEMEGISNSFKYAGEVLDEETGLYYLRARYYDPEVGRFINEDTYEGELTNPLSLNLYTYVENNPLIYFDPFGHRKESDNDELAMLVEPYTNEWNNAHEGLMTLKNAMNNCQTTTQCEQAQRRYDSLAPGFELTMLNAEKGADAVRVKYYQLQEKKLPGDVKYRDKAVYAPDITESLNGLMLRYEYMYQGYDQMNPLGSLTEFYYLVRNGAELDLKNHGWNESYYVYDGLLIRGDAPGNIVYGYVGRAFGYTRKLLVHAAGAAQVAAGTSGYSYITNSYGDDPSDVYYIDMGIQIYSNWH